MDAGLELTVLTLFPDLVQQYFATSIMARSVERGIVSFSIVDVRQFATDRHRSADDAPYGGGAGMVLLGEPLAAALESVDAAAKHVIYPSPAGLPYRQRDAERLASRQELVVICGRYEGIDQRVIDRYVDEEISIGDYVLSSGEVAAMAIVDSIFRLRGGAIREESTREESFSDGLLEYPHFTRPLEFAGRGVPPPLVSGHHARIEEWRMRQRLKRTASRRPDLIAGRTLTSAERTVAWQWIEKETDDERDPGN